MFTAIIVILLALSFSTMSVMIFTAGRRSADSLLASQSTSEILEPAISTTAYNLVAAARRLIRYISIRLLVALRAFAALGLEELGEVGEKFDPSLHEALGQDATDEEIKDDTITSVLEKGWRVGDTIIRPAKVKVAHFA